MNIVIVVCGETPTANRMHEEWRPSIETAMRYISSISSGHEITLVLSGGKTVPYLPSEAECGQMFLTYAYPEECKHFRVLLEEHSRTMPEHILYSKYVLATNGIAPDILVVVCKQSYIPKATVMMRHIWEYGEVDCAYVSVPDKASCWKQFFETVFLTALSHLDPRGNSFFYTLFKRKGNG